MSVKLKDKKKLKHLLIINGFSQRGFASEIKISGPYLNQIANGTRDPSPKVAKKICDGLAVKFEDIFFVNHDNKSYQKTNTA